MSAQTGCVKEALSRTASFEIPAGLPANTRVRWRRTLRQKLAEDYRYERRSVRTDIVRVMAAPDSTVLIYGETGAGKELIAHLVRK